MKKLNMEKKSFGEELCKCIYCGDIDFVFSVTRNIHFKVTNNGDVGNISDFEKFSTTCISCEQEANVPNIPVRISQLNLK